MRAAAALGLAFVTALPAQQIVTPASDARAAVVADKNGLVLPAGEFTAPELVDAVASYLCRNYLYDHAVVAKVQGFTLQRAIALDAPGSEEMLYALLAARGLAVLPLDEVRGVFQIVPLLAERHAVPVTNVPWRTPDEIQRRPRLRELVMTVVAVENLDANLLANGLRAQFAQQGMWQPGTPTACAAGSHTLLLHGYRDQLAPLLFVVQQLDRAAEPAAPTPDGTLLARVTQLERELQALRDELRAAAKR